MTIPQNIIMGLIKDMFLGNDFSKNKTKTLLSILAFASRIEWRFWEPKGGDGRIWNVPEFPRLPMGRFPTRSPFVMCISP